METVLDKKKQETVVALCSFCKRPKTAEFSTKKKSPFCTRKDCKKARKTQKKLSTIFEDEGVAVPIILGDESELAPTILPKMEESSEESSEEQIATTTADKVEKEHEHDAKKEHDLKEEHDRGDAYTETVSTVRVDEYGAHEEKRRVDVSFVPKAELSDEPILVQVRARADGWSDQDRLMEKIRNTPLDAVRVCEKHNKPRCAECKPESKSLESSGLSRYAWLNDTDPIGMDPVTKRIPVPPPPPPPLEVTLRDEWLTEKLKDDAIEAEKNKKFIFIDPDEVKWSTNNIRLLCKLTRRDLVTFIKDEKFRKPLRIEEREIPVKRKHRRKPDEPVAKKTETVAIRAITEEEEDFYCDLANGNLTVEEMIVKYGIDRGHDEEIDDLENKIMRHAVKVGLVALPQSRGPSLDLDYNEENSLAIKTGGAPYGRIHSSRMNRYGKDKREPLNTFRTNPKLKETRDYGGGDDGGKAPEHDDYGDDSSA